MEKIFVLLFVLTSSIASMADLVRGDDVTICNYQSPLKVVRRTIMVEKKPKEQCQIYLDKIENIFDSKKDKITITRKFSYKTPDCNIDTSFDSFRLVNNTKSIGLDKKISIGLTITKIDKKYCDQFPPNSLIINRPGR